MNEPDVTTLDPGIRDTVQWMLDLGYETTDSGDGKTKPAQGDADALPYPHVSMRTTRERLTFDADKLLEQLREIGIPIAPAGEDASRPAIQATYDPADGSALLILTGVDDALFAANRSPPSNP